MTEFVRNKIREWTVDAIVQNGLNPVILGPNSNNTPIAITRRIAKNNIQYFQASYNDIKVGDAISYSGENGSSRVAVIQEIATIIGKVTLFPHDYENAYLLEEFFDEKRFEEKQFAADMRKLSTIIKSVPMNQRRIIVKRTEEYVSKFLKEEAAKK